MIGALDLYLKGGGVNPATISFLASAQESEWDKRIVCPRCEDSILYRFRETHERMCSVIHQCSRCRQRTLILFREKHDAECLGAGRES